VPRREWGMAQRQGKTCDATSDGEAVTGETVINAAVTDTAVTRPAGLAAGDPR